MIHDGIRTGEYTDYADAARTHGLTRARITQIMGLLLLAPDIQEDVLALRFPAGREPVTERHLRHVFGHPIWADQRREWRPIKKRGETEAADALRRAEAGR